MRKQRKYYSKLNKQDPKLENLTAIIKNMMDKNEISYYLSENIYSPKDQGPTTVVPNNKKSPTLEGGYSKKKVAWGISNMRSAHKLLWTPHKYRTQRRHWCGHQELLKPHKYVSKYVD